MNSRNDALITHKFNEVAHAYDQQRRRLIPCFDDFYQIGTHMAISAVKSQTPKVLDLGAGTGLFSSLILHKYPEAEVTLMDISDQMLEKAGNRLSGYAHVQYVLDDYTNYEAPGTYDVIISALSIHHLTDTEKQRLYRNSFLNLKVDGVFVNADQVLGHTPFIDEIYKQDWKAKVESSDLTEDEIMSAYERTKLDRMAPLSDQLQMLRESGYSEVDCIYKYYNFVVMYGRK